MGDIFVPSDPTRTYLFVDGGYLRKALEKQLHEPCGTHSLANIDFDHLRRDARAKRAFYFDCVEEGAEEQKRLLSKIRMCDSYHVRTGVLAAKRQKEVDVQLAVEMLHQAVRKNYDCAVLLAGDRDFRPVVDAVVDLGPRVVVWYEPSSASTALLESADHHEQITPERICRWVDAGSQKILQRPS